MTAWMPLFAQTLDNLAARPLGTGTRMVIGDLVWVLWLALGLAVLLFAWARYGRRSKRREHRSHRPAIVQNSLNANAGLQQEESADDSETEDGTEDEEGEDSADKDSSKSSGRRRKRRRRGHHRPRNPTLEETGGLPPTRPGDPPSTQG